MFHSFLWRCGTFLVECRLPRLLFVGRTCIMNHVLLILIVFALWFVLAIVSHIFASIDISKLCRSACRFYPLDPFGASGKLGGSYLELCPQPIRTLAFYSGSWGSDVWGKASWKKHFVSEGFAGRTGRTKADQDKPRQIHNLYITYSQHRMVHQRTKGPFVNGSRIGWCVILWGYIILHMFLLVTWISCTPIILQFCQQEQNRMVCNLMKLYYIAYVFVSYIYMLHTHYFTILSTGAE